MPSDALPGNAASSAGEYGPPPFIAGGMTPGVDQAALAGASFHTGLMAGAQGQWRQAGSSDDVPSPQTFRDRPSLADALASTSLGDETAAESLPGRLYPLGSGDGEQSWANGVQGYPR